mgnify:CR=1 FL=1
MLDAFSRISTTACAIRVNIATSLPLICTVVTVHNIINGCKFTILSFSAIDRWLSLAKPFQYDNILVASSNLIFTFVKNSLLETDYCIETGLGFMYPRSSNSYIALLTATSFS